MNKNKFLTKLNIDIKDYNNELEKILENKLFSFDVKNLLLSMLYKIENAYKDYETVKVEVPSKREYIEDLLRIIIRIWQTRYVQYQILLIQLSFSIENLLCILTNDN